MACASFVLRSIHPYWIDRAQYLFPPSLKRQYERKKGRGLASNPAAAPTINSVASSLRLLKVATATESLKDDHNLRSMDSAVGELWVGQSPANAPGWVNFIGQLAPAARTELRTQSCTAILFVEASKPAKRLFALYFGQGHHSLDESAIERGFGLKVTLNQVSRDRLRTIDSATLDTTLIQRRTQASRNAGLGAGRRPGAARALSDREVGSAGARLQRGAEQPASGRNVRRVTGARRFNRLSASGRQRIVAVAPVTAPIALTLALCNRLPQRSSTIRISRTDGGSHLCVQPVEIR